MPGSRRAADANRPRREPESWLEAERIVVAVGRSSPLSERPATGHRRKLLSQMAVLLLRDVELPCESFGHLLLGGPGPVLMYRIGDSQVRVCIDVSLDAMSCADGTADLWPLYREAFPAALREPVEREFLAGRVSFMSNQMAPRTWYGRPGFAMIGDAVGYFHPLTAIGITLAVEDAACLADVPISRNSGRSVFVRARWPCCSRLRCTRYFPFDRKRRRPAGARFFNFGGRAPRNESARWTCSPAATRICGASTVRQARCSAWP